jgi:hypothetical protein
MEDFFGFREKRRKPVAQSLRTQALVRSGGKCEKCRKQLGKIKPHLHHKNGNPGDNKLSNIIVLCPNCHSELHEYKTVTETDMFGFETKRRKLVTKKVEPTKKKSTTTTKKKKSTSTTKRKSTTASTKRKSSTSSTKKKSTSSSKKKRRKIEEDIFSLF